MIGKMNQVLIVDDNEVFRRTLADLLHMWQPDLRVLQACNGAEGVEVALAKCPDLILVDGNMPIMDGITAARSLRGDPKTRNIPLIGMTAQHEFSGVADGLRALCNRLLPKPFDMMDLILTMRGLSLF